MKLTLIKKSIMIFKLRSWKITNFLFLIILIIFSCAKEEISPNELVLPQSFYFVKSEFIGSIIAYDSLGNITDDISKFGGSQNSFLFPDGWRYPYEIIEIKEDSSVFFYWTEQEYTNKDFGLLMVKSDTLQFLNNHEESIVGFFDDQILKIPAYGYRLEKNSSATCSNEFGYVDFQKILKRMKQNSYEKLFLQPFYLIYERR